MLAAKTDDRSQMERAFSEWYKDMVIKPKSPEYIPPFRAIQYADYETQLVSRIVPGVDVLFLSPTGLPVCVREHRLGEHAARLRAVRQSSLWRPLTPLASD